jgi:hypothetical protein
MERSLHNFTLKRASWIFFHFKKKINLNHFLTKIYFQVVACPLVEFVYANFSNNKIFLNINKPKKKIKKNTKKSPIENKMLNQKTEQTIHEKIVKTISFSRKSLRLKSVHIFQMIPEPDA